MNKLLYYFMMDTLLYHNLEPQQISNVVEACKGQKIDVGDACLTDLIAVPAFLIIMNPAGIKGTDLKEYYQWVEELGDKDYQVLFTNEPEIAPPKALIKSFYSPLEKADVESYKYFIMKRKSEYNRRIKQMRSYDRKIFRLMYIIREIRQKKIVFTKNLCKEFNVSQRTVERDIELITQLGDVIEFDKNNKGYRLQVEIL